MSKKEPKSYYLTLFKLEGHELWRAHLGSLPDSFSREKENWPNSVKVLEQSTLRIDRVTGQFISQ